MVSRRNKGRTLKILLTVFIFATASLAYFAYASYSDLQSKILIIAAQSSELEQKIDALALLQQQIENFKTDLRAKDLVLDDLRIRLGLAQSEVQELTPVIKSYYAAAVRESGEGMMIPFEVKIFKGTGAVSVNIKNVELLSGTQNSIRTAAQVAGEYTGKDISQKDVDVTFVNTLSEIVTLDGPSAGAAITLTIIAGLENKTANPKILMTGTINADSTVGQVGGIQQKAIAAKDFGATIFLVPRGQKVPVAGIEVAEYNKIVEATNLVLK